MGCAQGNAPPLALTRSALPPHPRDDEQRPDVGYYATVAVVSAPLNDECPGAFQLQVNTTDYDVRPSVEGKQVGCDTIATRLLQVAGTSNDDVWYRVTATGSTLRFAAQAMGTGAIGHGMVQWYVRKPHEYCV
ncbi:MAG: hypothetical protein IPL86_15795 [Flavobacteriales bacterium]|nr:hypothetical protein [Flavobacteriales bacterium]